MSKISSVFSVALLLGCQGCAATAQSSASHTIRAAEVAVRDLDIAVAPLYTQASSKAITEASSFSDYVERMDSWNRVEAALRGAANVLRSAGSAIDQHSWPCVLHALSELSEALAGQHVEVPRQITAALRFGAVYAGECK